MTGIKFPAWVGPPTLCRQQSFSMLVPRSPVKGSPTYHGSIRYVVTWATSEGLMAAWSDTSRKELVMAKPQHNPDEVERKQERAGMTNPDVRNPIAKGETISDRRAVEEANRKMTDRDIK